MLRDRADSLREIRRILDARPLTPEPRKQLFWLVKLIYACKGSGISAVVAEARLMEDALGNLGEYLETADQNTLRRAEELIHQFSQFLEAIQAP